MRQWQAINVTSETVSHPLTIIQLVNSRGLAGKSLNKELHPQNRIKRKQRALKSFEKICLTIERGNSFGCDAMAPEMNKLGQEQINLKIIAEKGTVPCPPLWEI